MCAIMAFKKWLVGRDVEFFVWEMQVHFFNFFCGKRRTV